MAKRTLTAAVEGAGGNGGGSGAAGQRRWRRAAMTTTMATNSVGANPPTRSSRGVDPPVTSTGNLDLPSASLGDPDPSAAISRDLEELGGGGRRGARQTRLEPAAPSVMERICVVDLHQFDV
uniref:Uncharacterized protein n=1 Tax=Leersia perrieri TaxID=77586 RepID=A0A0D9WP23_9ORYZ